MYMYKKSIGPPNSQNLMNLTYQFLVEFTNEILIRIQWNQGEEADHYIINVSPSVAAESVFITTNTAIQLLLLYNKEYNVSVVASNCAGNSTPADIKINIGTCM